MGGGGWIWVIGWLGEKMWWFVKKKREEEAGKSGKMGKKGIFSLYLGDKITYLKIGGGGQKYHILGKYLPLYYDV